MSGAPCSTNVVDDDRSISDCDSGDAVVPALAPIAVTFAIPYLPHVGVFGFVPLPGPLLGTITAITALYVGATEMTKRRFYRVVA